MIWHRCHSFQPIIGFDHMIPSLTTPISFIHVYRLWGRCLGTFSSSKPPLFPIAKLLLAVTFAYIGVSSQDRATESDERSSLAAAVVATANGDDRGCIDLRAWSAPRGADLPQCESQHRLGCTVYSLLSHLIFFPL